MTPWSFARPAAVIIVILTVAMYAVLAFVARQTPLLMDELSSDITRVPWGGESIKAVQESVK